MSGVAEAVGNWGFANCVSSKGCELERMKCIVDRMESYGPCSSNKKPPIVCNIDREPCVRPSPKQCLPSYLDPDKRPLMTLLSIDETILTSELRTVKDATANYPNRHYKQQGSLKWYKGNRCCCFHP